MTKGGKSPVRLAILLWLQKECKKVKSELWVNYKPSLFQHIGTHSSLKGKVQRLKVRSLLFCSHFTMCRSREIFC